MSAPLKLRPAIYPMPKKSPRLGSAPPAAGGGIDFFDVLMWAWFIVGGASTGIVVWAIFRQVFFL